MNYRRGYKMKKRIFCLIAIFAILSSHAISSSEDIFRDTANLKIHNAEIDKPTICCYDSLELNIDLSASYDNPFDPDQIEVLGHFIAPSGQEKTIPAFFYQEFSRRYERNKEYLDKVAGPLWKIRFTPAETGTYGYYIEATKKGKNGRAK